YQFTVGSLLLFNLPIAFYLLKIGFPSYSVLISFIIIEFIACTLRLIFLKRTAGLSIIEFSNRVLLKEIIPVLSSIIISYLIVNYIELPLRFILTGLGSSLVFLIMIYFFGLNKDEEKI